MKKNIQVTLPSKKTNATREVEQQTLVIQTIVNRDAHPELFAALSTSTCRRRAESLRVMALKHLLTERSNGKHAVLTERALASSFTNAPLPITPPAAETLSVGQLGASLSELFGNAAEIVISLKNFPKRDAEGTKSNKVSG